MGYEDLYRNRQEEDAQWAIRFAKLRENLGDQQFEGISLVQRKFEWTIFHRRNQLREQRALWAVRLEELRQQLGDEVYNSMDWIGRETAWYRLDHQNQVRKRREEVLADLASEERLAEAERAEDDLPYLTAADVRPDDYSQERDNHWAPFWYRPVEPVRKPVRRAPKLVREAEGEEEATIVEEAPEPAPNLTAMEQAPSTKATKTKTPKPPKPTKPVLFNPQYEISHVNEAYVQFFNPALSPDERKDKLAQANAMLQILQRDIWNSLEVKKRKEHLRGAPLPATKAFKEVRQETAGSGGEDSEADSEESDDEPVVTITESPKATPAVRVSPAQKTPSRKRKAADDADLDLDAPAEEASKRATKKPAAEKPPANKPRMARPTTVAAKLNPSLLLSPPTTSEARSSVSPDQTIRQFDATKLLDGPSAASTALATAIAEENPEPAIPPALPAPRKRGRPRKNAAVTAAGVGTTGVDTKAPAPKKHGQPPKNPVP